MNEKSQKRKIIKFLKGKIKEDIDSLCLYQWVERCYFHGWWKMGVALGSYIPPFSLNQEFHKRLEYLLSECRRNTKENSNQIEIPRAKITSPSEYNTKLRVSYEEAKSLLSDIPNATFQRAIKRNWHVNEEGYANAQSILWLFCWAKTGMGSLESELEAQNVFNKIFPFTYEFFDSRVDHEWARRMRYSRDNIEEELARLLS
jgi:hypothetical protein